MAWLRIASPAQCPDCRGTVWLPALKAYRYAGSAREHAGDLCACAACACQCVLMRDGAVLRVGRAASASAGAGGPEAGGHGTGRPGGLDPDMITFDTLDGR